MTKNTRTILLAGVGLYAVYLAGKYFGKSQEEKELQKLPDRPSGDQSTIAMVGGLPFTKSDAASAANTLYASMESLGSDENAILRFLSQGFNGKALQMIYAAYGTRAATGTGRWHMAWKEIFGGVPQDLGTWFQLEFLDKPQVLEAVRTIFKKANISF